jgi:DNA-binding IclR family transcriptional regulator
MPSSHGACAKQLLVLDTLSELGTAGVTAVADAVSLPKSTVHYHLDTLVEEGYVVRDDGAYALGLRFLEFGDAARRRLGIYEAARSELETLAETTGELALLMTEQRGLGVYVDKRHGENAIDVDAPIGRHAPLHNRALGKAILAHLPDERVDEVIDRHGLPATTERTITERDRLSEELARIREDGVSFNEQESVNGIRGVAVPILGTDGVEGALSIAGPVARLRDDEFEQRLVDRLDRSRNVIELTLQNE